MVWALSATQQGFEERSRTISLAVVAIGVLICGLRFFKDALIPLVLAIALKHLLQPVINVLTNRPLRCCGRSLLAEPMAIHPKVSKGTRPAPPVRVYLKDKNVGDFFSEMDGFLVLTFSLNEGAMVLKGCPVVEAQVGIATAQHSA